MQCLSTFRTIINKALLKGEHGISNMLRLSRGAQSCSVHFPVLSESAYSTESTAYSTSKYSDDRASELQFELPKLNPAEDLNVCYVSKSETGTDSVSLSSAWKLTGKKNPLVIQSLWLLSLDFYNLDVSHWDDQHNMLTTKPCLLVLPVPVEQKELCWLQ